MYFRCEGCRQGTRRDLHRCRQLCPSHTWARLWRRGKKVQWVHLSETTICAIITEATNQLQSNTMQKRYRPVVKSTRPESVMQILTVNHLKWTSQHWCDFQNNVLYFVLYWDPYYRLAKHLFKAYFRQNPVLFYYFLMSVCRKQNNNSNNNKK